MRGSDTNTNKKYRRWPPRVKRRRNREESPEPTETWSEQIDRRPAREETSSEVKVSFRHRRKPRSEGDGDD
jgi:hypothetical protein